MMGKKKMSGGQKGGGDGKKTNTGACSGPKKTNESRGDVTKTPTSKNPYPNGLS